jgi:hypothetical protein
LHFFGSTCAQNGGGIPNSGTLTLTDVAVVANRAGDGPAAAASLAASATGVVGSRIQEINAEMVKAFLSSIEYRQRFGQ